MINYAFFLEGGIRLVSSTLFTFVKLLINLVIRATSVVLLLHVCW